MSVYLLLPAFAACVPLTRCAVQAAPVAGANGQKASAKAQPQQFTAQAGQPSLTYVDPRTGKLICKAQASSLSGLTNASGSAVGTLNNVHGVFYQNGVATDRFAAPTFVADQASRTITATGGVMVHSITDPGTSVRCDRLVWRYDTNQMVGTGHVVLKKGGFTQTGPSFLADTKMRTLVMPAPSGHGATRGHSVHASWNK